MGARGRRRRGLRSPREERGAIALLAVIGMTVLLISAAFTIDLGMQRVARADMQSLADVVALDLAHELNQGRTVAYFGSGAGSVGQTLADGSLARNQSVIGKAQASVTPTWGSMDATTNTFTPMTSGVPTAVQVVAKTRVGFSFVGFTGVASGAASRSAAASADKGACFKLGSFVAQVDSGDSALLNPILSEIPGANAVSLSAISYEGLAGANVSLADLVSTGQLSVGSVSALLSAQGVSVAGLVRATAQVMHSNGGYSAAQLTAIDSLVVALSASTGTVNIGDLISAQPSDPAALGSHVNVLDLITGSAFLSDNDHAVTIPALQVGPANLAGLTVKAVTKLTVIEKPGVCSQGADGSWTAHNAQISLTTEITSAGGSLGSSNLSGLTGISADVKPFDLFMTTSLGDATAKLVSVDGCTSGSPTSVTFQAHSAAVNPPTITGQIEAIVTAGVGTTAANSVSSLLNAVDTALGNLLSPLAPILTIGAQQLVSASFTADVKAGLTSSWATAIGANDQTVVVPAADWLATPEKSEKVQGTVVPNLSGLTLQSSSVTISAGSDVTQNVTSVLGVPVLGTQTTTPSLSQTLLTAINNQSAVAVAFSNAATNALTPVLNSLTTNLQSSVIAQVQSLLGANIGGARLWVDNKPLCGAPRLVK